MSTFAQINEALVKAVANMNILPVEYENIPLSNNKAPYIRMTVLPGETEYATLGLNGYDRHQGILQLDVFVPSGSGITDLIEYCDLINQYFYPSKVLQEDTLCVRIDQCSIGPRLYEDGWCQQPVSINYFAWSNRVTGS